MESSFFFGPEEERMVRAVVEKRLGDGEAEMECENGSYAKT